MSVAFAIGPRCGFNLTASEEVLLLEAYRHVSLALSHDPNIKTFEHMMFVEGKGIEERAIIAINGLIKQAEYPHNLCFYPKMTDWTDHMRTRGDERIALRRAIQSKLEVEAERNRIVTAARKEYETLEGPKGYIEPEYEQMFEDAVDRIRGGVMYMPRPRTAPIEQPQPVLSRVPVQLAASRPAPIMAPVQAGPLLPAAIPVAQLANRLAALRREKADITARIEELRRLEDRHAELTTQEDELKAQIIAALEQV